MQRVWVTSRAYQAAVEVLVVIRTERGLSQRDLAERLGKPRSFVSKIENKERRLDMVELVAYAKGLGMTPGDLAEAVAAALPDPIDF